MKKVCINAGHGGKDSGAINGVITEKEINLKVMLHLKELLELNGNFDVLCTREDDSYLSLADRVSCANSNGADLYLSIHHNAGGGDGYDIIHSIHAVAGIKLAQIIADEFKSIGQNPHGAGVFSKESTKYASQDYYYEIKHTNMTAIISEFAFMDSRDFEAIDTLNEMYEEACALYEAICEFYGFPIVYKTFTTTKQEKVPHWADKAKKRVHDSGLVTSEHDYVSNVTWAEFYVIIDRLLEIEK